MSECHASCPDDVGQEVLVGHGGDLGHDATGLVVVDAAWVNPLGFGHVTIALLLTKVRQPVLVEG